MIKWNVSRTVSSLAVAAMLTTIAGGSAIAADTPANFPKDKVTIEIWWHEYGPFTAYVKELIEAYKKVRPNVTINPVVMSSGDIAQKVAVGFATGTGPHILDQDASFYELYYNKGVLEPLNLAAFGVKSYDELLARYTPGGIAAGTFGGKVYALPYQGNSMSLFISNKAFREAGLDPVKDAPKTWDDMKALGPKLKKVQGFRLPVSQPALGNADVPAAGRAVRRQAAVRRRQVGFGQQPRGGQGVDALARRHQAHR
jgi:multiple sugar transport system substrate-binding protein